MDDLSCLDANIPALYFPCASLFSDFLPVLVGPMSDFSFIHSFIKYLLDIYCELSNILTLVVMTLTDQ